ncbi:MAG: diacylglycerol kinase family protein [Minisyncoccia bacterium]
MRKLTNSFLSAFQGLLTTWKEERNFRIEIIASIFVTVCVIYYEFSFVESVFCVIAITFVLCAEIINTAIEDLCNKIESNHDPMIGKIKDISSAFVLVSASGALIVGLLVFYNHFF